MVQTVGYRIVYVLFFIAHDRRELVHFEVTSSPTAAWGVAIVRAIRPSKALDVLLGSFRFSLRTVRGVCLAHAANSTPRVAIPTLLTSGLAWPARSGTGWEAHCWPSGRDTRGTRDKGLKSETGPQV